MSQVLLLTGNPSKRRKAKRKSARRRRGSARRHVSRRRRSSSRKRSRTYIRARRNPSMRGILGSIKPTIMNGLVGAGGALANDLAFGYGSKYLPAMLTTGIPKHLTKLFTAVLIGTVGGKVMAGKGAALANGAATVVLRDALAEQIKAFAPTLPLGEYMEPAQIGYMDSAQPIAGDYVREYADVEEGMGEYMGDDD